MRSARIHSRVDRSKEHCDFDNHDINFHVFFAIVSGVLQIPSSE